VGFQFKQFTIEHEACAMKVGTDSIMLGSWVKTNNAQRILDIGTGSGLLVIMLAQKTQDTCLIDGIDIDAAAISQAKDNAKNCPWSERLIFRKISLQNFHTATKYDLIVSNPPYFSLNATANKTCAHKNRVMARQTITLDHKTLLGQVMEKLSDDGRFCCVLPKNVGDLFIKNAELIGLDCTRVMYVKPKPHADITRLLLEFGRHRKPKSTENINIYNQLDKYSTEYIALCKDYYLNF
jgi:tRNA1Val (adenine37-N6)-methyltransferase